MVLNVAGWYKSTSAWLGLALLLAAVLPSGAADPVPPVESVTPGGAISRPDLPTPEGIKAAIAALDADASVDAAARSRIKEQYDAALRQLEAATRNRAREAEYRAALTNAPLETARLRELLKTPPTTAAAVLATNAPDGLAPERLRELAAEEGGRAQTLKSRLTQLNQQLAEWQARTTSRAPQRQNAARLLAETETSLAGAVPGELSTHELQARNALLVGRKLAAQSELDVLDLEALAQSALSDLLTVQREVTTRELSLADAVAGALQARVTELNAAEARRAEVEAAKAQVAARDKHPLIQALALTNAAFAGQLQTVTALNTNLTDRLRQLEDKVARTARAFTNITRQFEQTGLNEALAEIMINEGRRLRQFGVTDLRRAQTEVRAMAVTNAIARLKAETEFEQLLLADRYLAALMKGLESAGPALSTEELTSVRTEAEVLLVARRKILEPLQTGQNRVMDQLHQLDLVQTEAIQLAAAFTEYIQARLMWTPSSPAIGLQDLHKLQDGLTWFFGSGQWRDVGRALGTVLRGNSFAAGLLILLAVAALGLRPRWTRLHRQFGGRVRSLRTDSIAHTLRCLLLSVLEIAPLLLLPYMAGRALNADAGNSEFVQAFGFALQRAVSTTIYLALLLAVCRREGLAEAHFRWNAAVVGLLRRNAAVMLAFLLPAYLVLGITFSQLRSEYQDSLGRLVYVASLLLMCGVFFRLLHPRRGRLWAALELPAREAELTRDSLIIRLRRWWFPVLVGFPLWLIMLTVTGYVYTAVRLTVQVNASLLLVVAVVTGYFLIVRWLAVKKGKLAFQQRLERLREAAGTRNEAPRSGDAPPPPDEPEIDLAVLTFQTRQMIRTFAGLTVVIGLWLIWSTELPALEYLNRVKLWEVTGLVDGVQQPVPITLAGVIAAVALSFLFVVAYRNLPGMLEIMVLQNFELPPGNRYAITTISQYLVATVGIVLVLNHLGMNWSQLGWIAAALSVGLGFGLQEVVANFVCGILIFVERPVRVGDIVTVADVTGTITRIQIRATTITDWDRKEFIVPNKEFIIGRVLNWTLSNSISRITINVGIAYGADPELACRLLLEAARQQPLVMTDPAPMAHFEGFGESSLDLALRCYLPSADNRLDTMHALRTAIIRKFKAAGIEIPYPQRDLHIRSAEPLVDVVRERVESRADEARL